MHMDITEYVDALRRDLAQAARAMGPETEQAAERIGFALDSSARLALMDALSHAAAEITNELEGTSVEVRLQGREPVFVVVGAGPSAVADDTQAIDTDDTTVVSLDDEGAETSRITLRLPEALKVRAEELATGRGPVAQHVDRQRGPRRHRERRPPMPGFPPMPPGPQFGPGAPGRNRSSNKRVQGWVR